MSAVQTPPRERRATELAAGETVPAASSVGSTPPQSFSTLSESHRRDNPTHLSIPVRRLSILGVALGFPLVVVAAGLVIAAHGKAAAPRPLRVAAATGTVIALQTGGASRVVVRLSTSHLLAVSSPRILTSDGQLLSAANVRPGDTVDVQGDRVVDTSQTWTTLQGLVAAAPDPQGNTMIVQLSQGGQIIVDIDRSTQINGVPATSASALLIFDADRVQLRGLLDKQFGEMTQTVSIASSTP